MTGGVDKIMAVLGKAAYLGYCNTMEFEPHWDKLSEQYKSAWIAAAHEALSIKHIITNHKPDEVA